MTNLLTNFEEDDKFLERITNLDALAKNEKKRCQIQDFEVDAKIPSMEARQQWRSSLTIVKNRARRFGMISNLDALDENEKRCQIQEKIRVAFYVQKAALQYIDDHDTKTLTKSGGAEGRAQKVSVSLTEGVPSSELHIREKIYGANRYAERPARSFLTCAWEALQGFLSVPNWNLQHDNGVKTQNLVILDDVWRKETLDRLCDIPGRSIFVVSRSNLTEPNATYDVEMLRGDEAICRCASGQKSVHLGFSKSLVVKQVAPPQHQVFINFRGELRNNFISHLVDALKRNQINVCIDYQEPRGEDVNILLKRIEESRIALVVFSSKYTESKWCLKEAAKIKDCAEQGRLKVLPIFYKVAVSDVRQLKRDFGDHFRDREWEYRHPSDKPTIEIWKEALAYISGLLALTFDETSRESESDFIGSIVDELLRLLPSIPSTSQSVSDRPRKAYYRRKMRSNKQGLEIEQSRNEKSVNAKKLDKKNKPTTNYVWRQKTVCAEEEMELGCDKTFKPNNKTIEAAKPDTELLEAKAEIRSKSTAEIQTEPTDTRQEIREVKEKLQSKSYKTALLSLPLQNHFDVVCAD